MVADTESTHVVLMQGGVEVGDARGLLGARPSRARLYAVWCGLDLAQYATSLILGNGLDRAGHHRLARLVEHATAGNIVQAHVRGAVHNMGQVR